MLGHLSMDDEETGGKNVVLQYNTENSMDVASKQQEVAKENGSKKNTYAQRQPTFLGLVKRNETYRILRANYLSSFFEWMAEWGRWGLSKCIKKTAEENKEKEIQRNMS